MTDLQEFFRFFTSHTAAIENFVYSFNATAHRKMFKVPDWIQTELLNVQTVELKLLKVLFTRVSAPFNMFLLEVIQSTRPFYKE